MPIEVLEESRCKDKTSVCLPNQRVVISVYVQTCEYVLLFVQLFVKYLAILSTHVYRQADVKLIRVT